VKYLRLPWFGKAMGESLWQNWPSEHARVSVLLYRAIGWKQSLGHIEARNFKTYFWVPGLTRMHIMSCLCSAFSRPVQQIVCAQFSCYPRKKLKILLLKLFIKLLKYFLNSLSYHLQNFALLVRSCCSLNVCLQSHMLKLNRQCYSIRRWGL
jgi:hypothetical protein